MAQVIAQRELRNDVSRILARVRDGEEFIVTVNGEEVAELRPVATRKGSTRAFAAAIAKLPPLSPEDRARLDALDEEIQNWPEDERDPWERWG